MKKLTSPNKNRINCLYLGLLMLALAIPVQASAERPRLWKISRPAAPAMSPAYILGISHQGYDDEYDAYFFDKVLPVFDTAAGLSFEYADLKKFQNVECPAPLAESAANQNMMRIARKLVRDRFENYLNTRIQNWNDVGDAKTQAMVRAAHADAASRYATSLSEYGVMMAIGDHPLNAAPRLGRPGVASFLRARRPAMVFDSIDEDKDMFDAYCGAGQDRPLLLQIQLVAASDLEDVRNRGRQRAAEEFRRSLEQGVFARSDVELSQQGARSLLCERNQKWLGKIKNAMEQKPTFFALGLAHLMPAAAKNVPCDDLLSALRREGMLVDLIR
jgi:hypothetical protein